MAYWLPPFLAYSMSDSYFLKRTVPVEGSLYWCAFDIRDVPSQITATQRRKPIEGVRAEETKKSRLNRV